MQSIIATNIVIFFRDRDKNETCQTKEGHLYCITFTVTWAKEKDDDDDDDDKLHIGKK